MILKNLSVFNWSVRMMKFGMALTIFLSLFSCNSDEEEDLVGNWVKMSDFEGIPRSDAVVVSLDGKAYVTTGYDGEDRLTDLWEYNPVQDYWIQKADFPGSARNGAVGFGADGKAFVGTGYDGTNKLNDLWAYDPSTNEWTEKADFAGSARYGAIAFSIDDKGYIGTGYDGNYLKDFYEYDPTTDSWTQKVSVGGSKRRDAMAFVIDGKGFVCGGIDNGLYEDDFWEYDPSTNLWDQKRDISDATDDDYDDDYSIVRTNATAFVSAGKAYICTGGKSSTGVDVWEYTPSTDLWEEKTEFEGAARSEAVGFTINDIGYIATGRNSSYYFDDVWRFEPNAEYNEYD